MKNAVEFVNVSLNFGGVKALDDISFEVKEGSLFSIIGPNGAGKTSVFNCVNGIYRPTSGEIKIYDQEIADLKPDKIANLGVSRTFQNIELFDADSTKTFCIFCCSETKRSQELEVSALFALLGGVL